MKLRSQIAVFLLAIWATVPLLPLVHGLHAHRYCEAHQTVEEAGPSFAGTASHSSDGVFHSEEAAPAQAHEECAVVAAEHRPVETQASCIWLVADAALPDVRPLHAQAFSSQLELLALAPKSSPPNV